MEKVLTKAKLEKERLPFIITFIVGLSTVLGCIAYALFSLHNGILFIPVILGFVMCRLAMIGIRQ